MAAILAPRGAAYARIMGVGGYRPTRVVPNEVMGRTSSSFLLVSMVLQVVVTLSVGPLVNQTSARGGFVLLAGIVAVGLAVLAAVSAPLRRVPRSAAETA